MRFLMRGGLWLWRRLWCWDDDCLGDDELRAGGLWRRCWLDWLDDTWCCSGLGCWCRLTWFNDDWDCCSGLGCLGRLDWLDGGWCS